MARASKTQNAFNAGELSPLILARQDIKKYDSGLSTCFNSLPFTQGGWTRRPGTAFLHQTKFNDRYSRVVPFQYSVEQTYVLEIGHLYIRFYTNHGILTQAEQNITSVSQAAVGVVTRAGHSYLEGDRIELFDSDMTQLNNREVVATNVTGSTFELYDSDGVAINTTNYDAFTTGKMARIVEVITTYTEGDIPTLKFTQSTDTLWIFHTDHQQATLVRESALVWTLADFVLNDGPYDTINSTLLDTTPTTFTPSSANVEAVITASSTAGINDGLGFLPTDVGRSMRMREGTVWGWGIINSYISTTQVVITIGSTLTNTNAKATWRLGVFSDTTGWPSCGTFFEDRLVLAGAALFPSRLDMSKSGAYSYFAPSALADGTVAADNAVSFVLNSDDVQAIKWVSAHDKGLLVGTGRAEWLIRASSLNEAVTPTNISGKPSTRHGTADVAPAFASRAVLFAQRGKRKLRELAYDFTVDGFRAPDLSMLAEHITHPSLEELAYQEQPQAVMWAVRGDGKLIGMTYERDQDVVGWHRHELGGTIEVEDEEDEVLPGECVVVGPRIPRYQYLGITETVSAGGTPITALSRDTKWIWTVKPTFLTTPLQVTVTSDVGEQTIVNLDTPSVFAGLGVTPQGICDVPSIGQVWVLVRGWPVPSSNRHAILMRYSAGTANADGTAATTPAFLGSNVLTDDTIDPGQIGYDPVTDKVWISYSQNNATAVTVCIINPHTIATEATIVVGEIIGLQSQFVFAYPYVGLVGYSGGSNPNFVIFDADSPYTVRDIVNVPGGFFVDGQPALYDPVRARFVLIKQSSLEVVVIDAATAAVTYQTLEHGANVIDESPLPQPTAGFNGLNYYSRLDKYIFEMPNGGVYGTTLLIVNPATWETQFTYTYETGPPNTLINTMWEPTTDTAALGGNYVLVYDLTHVKRYYFGEPC